MKSVRRELQFVFQDPFSSLDPRMTAGSAITEPLAVHGLVSGRGDRRSAAVRLLQAVGLGERHVDQWPRQFSGGQRQRLGIIRAFAIRPKLIVADEPVSALDVSVRSQVINLLQDLQEEQGTAYLFISHDMATVKHMADRLAVMYLGRIVELASKRGLLRRALSPVQPGLAVRGSVLAPAPGDGTGSCSLEIRRARPRCPQGCRFHPRCPIAQDRCRVESPEPRWIDQRRVECHFARPWPLAKTETV